MLHHETCSAWVSCNVRPLANDFSCPAGQDYNLHATSATSCESEAGAMLYVKTLQLMLQLLQKISVYVIMGYWCCIPYYSHTMMTWAIACYAFKKSYKTSTISSACINHQLHNMLSVPIWCCSFQIISLTLNSIMLTLSDVNSMKQLWRWRSVCSIIVKVKINLTSAVVEKSHYIQLNSPRTVCTFMRQQKKPASVNFKNWSVIHHLN